MMWMDFDAFATSTVALVTKSKRWFSISFSHFEFFSSFCKKTFSNEFGTQTHHLFTIGKEVKLNQKLNILRWQWKMSCAVRSTLMHVTYSNNSSNFRFRWNSRVTELTSNDLLAMSTVHFIWSDNWRLLFMMRLPTVWWTLNSCHYFLYLSGQVFVRFVAIIILLKLATSSAKWASYELALKWWCIFRTHFLNATKEYNGKWLPRFVSTKYLPFNAQRERDIRLYDWIILSCRIARTITVTAGGVNGYSQLKCTHKKWTIDFK